MDFSLDDDLIMIRDSVSRFVTAAYGFEARKALLDSDDGFAPDNWRQFAELGWLGAALPEDFGGIGMGAKATMVIMGELGKGLVLEPYLATVILGGEMIARHGSAAQKDAILPSVAAGEMMLTLAHAEPGARYDLNDVATTARKSGDGFIINGAKHFISSPVLPDFAILFAWTGVQQTKRGERKLVTAFLIDRDTPGFTIHRGPRCAAQRAYHTWQLSFDRCRVHQDQILGAEGQGFDLADKWLKMGRVWVAAAACGNSSANRRTFPSARHIRPGR